MTGPQPSSASVLVRYGQVAALLLVALALALRVSGTGEWWLNPDEGIYFSILTQPTLSAFWAEVAENAHPPLYYLILRVVGFFTTDFFWYRALSLLGGTAAVFALWHCGREMAWRDPVRRTVTGLAAAALLVPSPPAITLSQIMRPYMFQLALVAGALAALLRYGRAPERRALAWYLTLLVLALLTHYSSVLALGALGGVAVYLVFATEMPSAARRELILAHTVPVLLVGALYFLHLRGLASSDTAGDALEGWLSFYLVNSPREAWLALAGLLSTVGGTDFGGPVVVLMLVGLALAAWRREWIPLVAAGSALLVGWVAAAAGVYPMGATRHSTWMLAFVVPALAWAVGFVFTSGRRWAAVGLVAAVALVAGRKPVSTALDVYDSPWAAPERVLSQESVTQMLALLEPSGAPRIVVMDLQTYYLLLPFYYVERQEALSESDDAFFHFRYGERDMVVVRSWLLTADGTGARSDFLSLTARTERAAPELDMAAAPQVQVLVGGWRSEVVDQLLALEETGIVTNYRLVPGLFAFLVDMDRLNPPEAPVAVP